VPDETLAPGLLILDRFRLKRVLGSGGMGSVWEAAHLALGTDIAIKFLDSELSSRSDIRSRFAQEATAAARIKSTHVVGILDYGFTAGGRGFIVMERLRGEDLGQHLARTYTMLPAELAPIIAQACRGLGKAHALGIIHRDIKPENLFLHDEEGAIVVKLLDFGIAKNVDANEVTHKTDTGQILGTPLYMSPEQALGRPLDTRSDLYSLAVVAYRCLAGRPPFVHRATGELIVSISTAIAPPPSSFNPGVSASLDAWFAAMLLKDPHARLCQTAADLGDSFAAACRGVMADSGAPLGFSATMPGGSTPTLSDDSEPALRQLRREPRATQPKRRSRWLMLAPPLGLAIALTVAAIAWRGAREEQPSPEPNPIVASSAQPSPAPSQRSVNVHIDALPREAVLYLDGQRLPSNPFSAAKPLDPAPHRLRAEAPGYGAVERDLTLERDVHVELALSRVDPPKRELHSPPAQRTKAPGAQPRKDKPTPTPAPPRPEPERTPTPSKRPLSIDRTNPWQDR
jgi:hypothetical protein